MGGADVTLRLRGCNVQARAEAIWDEPVIAARIGEYVRHLPGSAKPLGVKLQNGVANCDDTIWLAKESLFVKIQL
jgi:hypothetical protein